MNLLDLERKRDKRTLTNVRYTQGFLPLKMAVDLCMFEFLRHK